LDAEFDAFMDEEYNEDKIGELHDVDIGAKDQVEKKLFSLAVDEFIEDKKGRFRELHKEYGATGDVQLLAKYEKNVIHEDQYLNGEDPEEVKKQLNEKRLALVDVFE